MLALISYGFLWKYNLNTGQWEKLSSAPDSTSDPYPYPYGFIYHAMTLYEDSIYVFGGKTSYTYGGVDTGIVYRYRNDTWEQLSSWTYSVSHHAIEVFDSILYTYGGRSDYTDTVHNMVWAYNITDNKWDNLWQNTANEVDYNTPSPPGLYVHSMTIDNGEYLYVYGGILENSIAALKTNVRYYF